MNPEVEVSGANLQEIAERVAERAAWIAAWRQKTVMTGVGSFVRAKVPLTAVQFAYHSNKN